jgi:hypothetical protein
MALGGHGRSTIAFYQVRMIDRNVRYTLLETRNRVAARSHDFRYQQIGFGNGPLGIVDEACLISLPGFGETVAIMLCEWANMHVLHALLARLENGLGAPLASVFLVARSYSGPKRWRRCSLRCLRMTIQIPSAMAIIARPMISTISHVNM